MRDQPRESHHRWRRSTRSSRSARALETTSNRSPKERLEQAALEGRTLFASAGDTGGSCPAVAAPIIGAGNGIANEGYPAINYPCGSDFAVCVGGTVLYTNVDSSNDVTSRNTEYSWTHTGGGSSLFIGQPGFQQKYLGSTPNAPGFEPQPCTLKYDLTAYPVGTVCRTVPDIAAQSGDVISNGYDTNFDMFPSAKRWHQPVLTAFGRHVGSHSGGGAAGQAQGGGIGFR